MRREFQTSQLKKICLFCFLVVQAHSSVERAGLLGGVKFRSLPVDDEYKLTGSTVAEAIAEDRKKGLIPFYVSFSQNIN